MEKSREILNAFVDGELPPEEMKRIASLLQTSPELEAYVKGQEKLRAALRMDGVLVQDIPEVLLRTARSAPISWRWRLKARLQKHSTSSLLAAAAGALCLGLVIGVTLQPSQDVTMIGGQMQAQGSLRTALDTQLASAGYEGKGPRIGISFRDRTGADCRTFRDGGTGGIACHRSGFWVITTLVASASEPSGPYRMAGSEMPDAVRQAVQASIVDRPYDAAAEARARALGWTGK